MLGNKSIVSFTGTGRDIINHKQFPVNGDERKNEVPDRDNDISNLILS